MKNYPNRQTIWVVFCFKGENQYEINAIFAPKTSIFSEFLKIFSESPKIYDSMASSIASICISKSRTPSLMISKSLRRSTSSCGIWQ